MDINNTINHERIEQFFNGYNPMERITNIECDYNDDQVSIIFDDENGNRKIKLVDFKPFCWVKFSACIRMYNGDRNRLKWALNKSGIRIKALKSKDDKGFESERLKNGFKYLFYATKKMSYADFMNFFKFAGTPIYGKKDDINQEKEFLTVTPIEQYMMSTGTRLFKGYDNYDDVKRLIFDLETTGLNPIKDSIDIIGIRTNKGFTKVINIYGETKEEKNKNELKGIREFLKIIKEQQPNIVLGYNSENFDWVFLIKRLEMLGTSIEVESSKFFPYPIYKKTKETVLKLGGEIEHFYQTVLWGTTIIDGLHAVRRAQAIDSNIKKATLKYMAQYIKLDEKNRVYVPGDKISTIWKDTNEQGYAYNPENGDWYKVDDKHPLKENYEYKSGQWIVNEYNLFDIFETDKVEVSFNETNFLVSKLLPTSFQRASTMGTAAVWKLIMLGWCYENELAIPEPDKTRRFTGGLSRLLCVGYVDKIVKLDYNSLYPSIILSWQISTPVDISHAMLLFLEYMLSQREKYKGLKKDAGKKADKIKNQLKNNKEYYDNIENKQELIKLLEEENYWEGEKVRNDKKQMPQKVICNAFFGSWGSGSVFHFSDIINAEKTTCIGRQSLRLMISWFSKRNYVPIVGDSFTFDTPLFIKYNNNEMIDIKPISEIINENEINLDALGREYDYSEKPYKVLCRSGWCEPKYIYRHKTNKDIYEVNDKNNNMKINVTEDHSLYDDKQNKISPKDINDGSVKLEYYTQDIGTFGINVNNVYDIADDFYYGEIERIPIEILNGSYDTMYKFLKYFNDKNIGCDSDIFNDNKSKVNWTKTNIAAMNYLINKVYKYKNKCKN